MWWENTHTLALVIDRLFYNGGFQVHFVQPTFILSAHWGERRNARTSVNSGNHLRVYLKEGFIVWVPVVIFFTNMLYSWLFYCTAKHPRLVKYLLYCSICYIIHYGWKEYVEKEWNLLQPQCWLLDVLLDMFNGSVINKFQFIVLYYVRSQHLFFFF